MKLTKEQIISYLEAGYEVECRNDEDSVFVIVFYNEGRFGGYGICDYTDICEIDSYDMKSVKSIEIRPRKFKPLPEGTEIRTAFAKGIYTIEDYDEINHQYNVFDKHLLHKTFPVNTCIPILEEPKEDWEKEFDEKFSKRFGKEMIVSQKELRDFAKNFLTNNK